MLHSCLLARLTVCYFFLPGLCCGRGFPVVEGERATQAAVLGFARTYQGQPSCSLGVCTDPGHAPSPGSAQLEPRALAL